MPGLTALVLAGTRPGGDPLAGYAGVSHKVLIDIGGTTMIERVVAGLAAAPAVQREAKAGRGFPAAASHPARSRVIARATASLPD